MHSSSSRNLKIWALDRPCPVWLISCTWISMHDKPNMCSVALGQISTPSAVQDKYRKSFPAGIRKLSLNCSITSPSASCAPCGYKNSSPCVYNVYFGQRCDQIEAQREQIRAHACKTKIQSTQGVQKKYMCL